MSPRERQKFDEIVEEVINSLPAALRRLLDEMPVIVEDRPDEATARELATEDGDDADDLLGLHTGTSFTDRGIDQSGEMPSNIRLYREGIVEEAGGWEQEDSAANIREEVRITLLHEIGHQFGLDEDDLDRLGYA